MQKVREAERAQVVDEYRDQVGEMVSGIVGYGYTVDEYGDKKYVIENKDEQKIITRMKKMRRDGLSYRRIQKILEDDEIKMTHMTVSNILRDEEKNKLKTRRVKEKIKSSFLEEVNK